VTIRAIGPSKDEVMPVVSITRLRVRSWRYLPAFFVQTLRIARHAAKAKGVLEVTLLRDSTTYWTGTSWSSEAAMTAFMNAAPHASTMRSLLEWCDEAALVRWTQDTADLPSWVDAHWRLEMEGRPSNVKRPSAAHTAHSFPLPIVSKTNQRRFK
jgi:hypothetical protein